MSEADDRRPVALLITPVLPLPGGSGRALRAWDWLLELAHDHRVHVLLCASPDTCPDVPTNYPATVHSLWTALAPTRGVRRRLGKLLPVTAVISRRTVADWLVPAATFAARMDTIAREIGKGRVARLVVFRFYLWDVGLAVAARCGDGIAELDFDDVESLARLSIAAACRRLGRFSDALDHLATAIQYWLVERTVPAACRTLWLAAAEDACRIPRRFPSVACRPNRMLPSIQPALEQPRPDIRRLLFVGTLNYPPNEESVQFLVGEVLPLLRGGPGRPDPSVRSWRLTIVGRHARPWLQAVLSDADGVDYVSDAEDLAPWYRAAAAVLVPVWAGGGTKFKTIEGFSHARPVVSTSHGVRGLDAEPGRHFLLAETAQEFVAAILALDNDQDLARRLAAAGRALFAGRYCIPVT